jgi:RecA/RadA recombinase
MAITKKKSKTSTEDFQSMLTDRFNAYFEPEKYKTGILPLDEVLGGYLQSGSLIELSSESGVGKSTMLLHLAKNLAEQGLKTLYIDSEGSVKDAMLDGIGLTPYLSTKNHKDNLFTLVRVSGYAEVEDLISGALQTGQFKLFVIDSLTALVGDVYLDLDENRNATENRVGYDALMTSRLLKKLNALKTMYNCIFFCISQTRVDLSNTFITAFKSTGGQAAKFFPDVRLFMKRKDKILDNATLLTGNTDKAVIGANVTIEATKSRQGIGFVPYPMTIYFGRGVSNLAAYQVLLELPQLVNSSGVHILEHKSTVTSVLHLDSGDYQTTGGKNGLASLIVEHGDEVGKFCNNYVSSYFSNLNKSNLEANYEERDDLILEKNESEDYSVDEPDDLDIEA